MSNCLGLNGRMREWNCLLHLMGDDGKVCSIVMFLQVFWGCPDKVGVSEDEKSERGGWAGEIGSRKGRSGVENRGKAGEKGGALVPSLFGTPR